MPLLRMSLRVRDILGADTTMLYTLPTGTFTAMQSVVAILTIFRGIYGADFQPQQLPADQITRVLYAFADIASDGEV
jgi:hypothetical protein